MANINPRYVEHYHLWRRDVKLYARRICVLFAFELTILLMNVCPILRVIRAREGIMKRFVLTETPPVAVVVPVVEILV